MAQDVGSPAADEQQFTATGALLPQLPMPQQLSISAMNHMAAFKGNVANPKVNLKQRPQHSE
jgi:hypothetical protein